jgi:hypothetical protein
VFSQYQGFAWVEGGVKQQEPQTDYSPSSCAEVKVGGTIPPFILMPLWCDAYLFMNRENLTYKERVPTEFANTCSVIPIITIAIEF